MRSEAHPAKVHKILKENERIRQSFDARVQ
jgi:hypothetical protein